MKSTMTKPKPGPGIGSRSGSTRARHASECVAERFAWMFAAASLNAGLFIGGDHEFVVLQHATLPLAGLQIQPPRMIFNGVGFATS